MCPFSAVLEFDSRKRGRLSIETRFLWEQILCHRPHDERPACAPVTDSPSPCQHHHHPASLFRAMHKIASSLLFLLFVHFSTWRYFVLVHADVSRRSPSSASNFLNSEANAFVPEENGISLQQQEQSLAAKTISPESTVVTQDDRQRNTNSRVLRVEDVTSKSIKVRLETRFGSDPIVPQKIFFKNIQRNSDWKHYVVDEKRHRDENGSFVLTNLLCGNKYQIYGLFIDPETGHSVSSEVLITKTTGREPLAPPVTTTTPCLRPFADPFLHLLLACH